MRIVPAMWLTVEEGSGDEEAPHKMMAEGVWIANTSLPVGEYAVCPVNEDGQVPSRRVLGVTE